MSTALADTKIESARTKVQQWGEGISRGAWDWHLLGHALQLVHEGIEAQPKYQRPWTLLADLYHRIGQVDLANEALCRSYKLATPGPNHPGRFYNSVAANVRSGYPFNSRGGVQREHPPDWFDSKYQRYWIIDQQVLRDVKTGPAEIATAFISYAREDEPAAERLRAELANRGVAVWKDNHALLPGESWEDVIAETIKSRDFVIVCLSRAATSKVGFFQVELKAALKWQQYRPTTQVYLIPARLEECEVPPELASFQYVNLYDDWQAGVNRLHAAIAKYASQKRG